MESLIANTSRIVNISKWAVRGCIIYKTIVDLIWHSIKIRKIKNTKLKNEITEVKKKEGEEKIYNNAENVQLNQIDTDFTCEPKPPKVLQPFNKNQYNSKYHIKQKTIENSTIENKVISVNLKESGIESIEKTKIRKIRRKTVSLILARLLGSSRKSKQKDILSSKIKKEKLKIIASMEGNRRMLEMK